MKSKIILKTISKNNFVNSRSTSNDKKTITIGNDKSESEKLAHIDLVTNLVELLADLLTTYNSIVKDIRKHENETNEDKLTMSRLTDIIK